MATTLEIVDLAAESQIQLVLSNDSGDQETAPPAPFPFPLSNAETAEIQWYLTRYLDDPYGPSKERGEAVASGLRNLGRPPVRMCFSGQPGRPRDRPNGSLCGMGALPVGHRLRPR